MKPSRRTTPDRLQREALPVWQIQRGERGAYALGDACAQVLHSGLRRVGAIAADKHVAVARAGKGAHTASTGLPGTRATTAGA